ncbi:helix-turn-helix domain-containing protein [Streptomyces sp. BV286]|nr:helix-turn-helix domain-containing protein [Streptomyces sp. BV286]
MRAGEMFERGCTQPEVARAVGVCLESVRRWKRGWEQDGTPALRRRPAAGQPPKLEDAQAAERWSRAPRRTVSRRTCGPWNGCAWRLSGLPG